MSAPALPTVHGLALVAAGPRWASTTHHDGQLTEGSARAHTARMARKLARLRDALGEVADLVEDLTRMLDEAWAGRADLALEYPSFEAYVAAEFGDLGQVRLPVPEHAALVLALYGDGERMSKRAVGRRLACDDATVRMRLRDHARQAPAPLALVSAPDDVATAAPAPQPSKADRITAYIAAAGPAGRTVHEIEAAAKRAQWPGRNNHGVISGSLSRDVVRRGRAVRTGVYREGAAVHVAPEHA